MTEQDAVGFWEQRYGERDQIWSGAPNQALVATATGLPPGRALDLGCGEGGDSVWLAEQGWQVTGVDISATAVERAKAMAARRGVPEGRFTWRVADLSRWRPAGPYELVSACFLHSPVDFPRTEVLRRAAGAVAPGGHLLIVGHAEPPPWAKWHDENGAVDNDSDDDRSGHGGHGHGGHGHDLLGPDEELAALGLPPAEWETVVGEVREREATGPDGQPAVLRDAVTLIRRRPS